MPVLSRLFIAGRSARRNAHAAEALHKPALPASPRSAEASRSHGQSQRVSRNSPTGPTLRANPFPKVTDLICRLPLPTLFYRLEAVHLGDLLRISVRPGTKFTKAPLHFQGPHEAHETPQEPRCFTEPLSISRAEPFPWMGLLNQKRELWLGLRATSATSFALPPLVERARRPTISVSWCGNINPLPFRQPSRTRSSDSRLLRH